MTQPDAGKGLGQMHDEHHSHATVQDDDGRKRKLFTEDGSKVRQFCLSAHADSPGSNLSTLDSHRISVPFIFNTATECAPDAVRSLIAEFLSRSFVWTDGKAFQETWI